MGYSLSGCKESDMTEQLNTHKPFIPHSVARGVFEKTYFKLCHFQPERVTVVKLHNRLGLKPSLNPLSFH